MRLPATPRHRRLGFPKTNCFKPYRVLRKAYHVLAVSSHKVATRNPFAVLWTSSSLIGSINQVYGKVTHGTRMRSLPNSKKTSMLFSHSSHAASPVPNLASLCLTSPQFPQYKPRWSDTRLEWDEPLRACLGASGAKLHREGNHIHVRWAGRVSWRFRRFFEKPGVPLCGWHMVFCCL